jgi:Spy/CpxP family protein refolding chaperone
MKGVTSFLLVSAFSAGVLFAQGPGSSGGTRNPPNPANMVQRKVQRLSRALELTPDQQTQATTIFTNAANTESTVFGSLKTERDNLKTAVQNNDLNTINQVANQIGNLTAQLTTAEATAEAQFYHILTPDQQSKLSQGHGFGALGPGAGPFGGGLGPNGFRPGRR